MAFANWADIWGDIWGPIWAEDGVTAALTGTAANGLTEAEIVAGGETIIITLTGDAWIAAGSTFEAQRQAIIDGLDAAASPATGWNNEVRDNLAVTAVVRTSDTVVTITLSAQAAYDIASSETVTVTVPALALEGGVAAVASPTFSVSTGRVFLSVDRIYRVRGPTARVRVA
jgi:hypothetical protein